MKNRLFYIIVMMVLVTSCHPDMEKARKENSLYLLEGDRIVIACEKYKQAHGVYPATLDDLNSRLWDYSKFDLRRESSVKMNYSGLGVTIVVEPIYYNYDFSAWEKGWQESDQSF